MCMHDSSSKAGNIEKTTLLFFLFFSSYKLVNYLFIFPEHWGSGGGVGRGWDGKTR